MTNSEVIVTGGRNYTDVKKLNETLGAMQIDTLIHGGASGADELAARWARGKGRSEFIRIIEYPALWERFNKSAGPMRNRRMLQAHRDAIVVAFPGGKGTKNMCEEAEKAGHKIIKVR